VQISGHCASGVTPPPRSDRRPASVADGEDPQGQSVGDVGRAVTGGHVAAPFRYPGGLADGLLLTSDLTARVLTREVTGPTWLGGGGGRLEREGGGRGIVAAEARRPHQTECRPSRWRRTNTGRPAYASHGRCGGDSHHGWHHCRAPLRVRS
jgi:hypothetical protein